MVRCSYVSSKVCRSTYYLTLLEYPIVLGFSSEPDCTRCVTNGLKGQRSRTPLYMYLFEKSFKDLRGTNLKRDSTLLKRVLYCPKPKLNLQWTSKTTPSSHCQS